MTKRRWLSYLATSALPMSLQGHSQADSAPGGSASEDAPRLASWRTPLALACLGLFVVLGRLHTYDEPFERDITTYAVVGHELLLGRELYSDLWDIKPPGIFVAYAAAESVAGYGPQAVYLLNVGVALFSVLGVYFAAAATPRSRGGLWAATAFAILSGNLALQANQPNAEAFVNACLVWALALLLRTRQPLGVGGAGAVGVLLFLASFFKPYVAVASLLLLAHALKPPQGTPRRTATREAILGAGVALASWLGVFAYFRLTGRLADLYEVLFVYGRHYARDPLGNVVKGLFEGATSLLPLGGVLGVALLGWAIGRSAQRRAWLLLGAYGIAAHLMVCLPGKFFPHYEQLWLPVLAVAFGRLVGDIGARISASRRWLRMDAVLAGLVVGGLLYTHLPSFSLAPEDWSRRKYGETFVLVKALAQDLDALLLPEETFFQVGAESGLYFYTRRSPPTGLLIARHYLEGPLKNKLQARIVRDLEVSPPELIVITRTYLEGTLTSRAHEPALRWILARYSWPAVGSGAPGCFPRLFERQGNQGSPFLFLARRGGSLEARLVGRLS